MRSNAEQFSDSNRRIERHKGICSCRRSETEVPVCAMLLLTIIHAKSTLQAMHQTCQAMFRYTVRQQQHPQPLSGAYINRPINCQDLTRQRNGFRAIQDLSRAASSLSKVCSPGQLLAAYDPGWKPI